MREYLAVDPASRTGLRWIKRPSRCAKAGDEAGSVNDEGYYVVVLKRVTYKNSRVIWTLHNGADPGQAQVDHINHDRRDNRIINLRLVSSRENSQNRTSHGAYPLGVSRAGNYERYRALIRVNGKQRSLGRFSTPELAAAAYQQACAELQSNAQTVNAD
jgi:hypothetical protein